MNDESIRLGLDIGGRSYFIVDGEICSPEEGQTENAMQTRKLDCSEARVLPGKVNAHTHLYSGLVPFGMPAPEPTPENFLQILERVWWRLDRALNEKLLRAAARYYICEALFAGTTTLIDHHESPNFIEGSLDILADACDELGIRALISYGATERNGGLDEASRGLAECRRFIENNDRARVQGMVGLHASFTVSDDTIIEAARMCRDMGASMHVHVAEDLADMTDARNRGYQSPVHRLYRLGALRPGSILAHGVHLDSETVQKASDEGLWFVHNPRSNENNNVGYAHSLAASDKVALGTDGFPSDMAAECAALARISEGQGVPVENAKKRMDAGSRLVAAHFGWEALPLDEGAVADLVIYAAGGVRHLLVEGTPVIEDTQLLTGDRAEIKQEAEAAAAELWSAMEKYS